VVYDKIGKQEFKVKAKVIVNCAGVFSDVLRKMNDENASKKTLSARGTHIIVDGMMSEGNGILVSATSDGRLVFILPYRGYTMIGTTDVKDEPSKIPEATE